MYMKPYINYTEAAYREEEAIHLKPYTNYIGTHPKPSIKQRK